MEKAAERLANLLTISGVCGEGDLWQADRPLAFVTAKGEKRGCSKSNGLLQFSAGQRFFWQTENNFHCVGWMHLGVNGQYLQRLHDSIRKAPE